MAEIFRALYAPAPGVTKQVVIKRILPHYAANKSFIGMFTNEAKIAMGLSHGNIAQVFDFGSIDGDYFLAMELVDGPPLSKVIKRAKAVGIPVIPPEIAAFVVGEVLKGLHYAHTRLDEHGKPLHIVHRDISPQNALLSYEGQVKLVDFGIARAKNAGPEETGSAAVKGKYAYFAPEQAKAHELDARTDVFAAGVVLYELVTGDLPFQGKMMEALTRLVRGQFHSPRLRNPRLLTELERIILKAMANERSNRYPTALAFADDLNRYVVNNHPDFTPARLGQFLQFLFEDELVKQGRPVQLPSDFGRRLEDWKEPVPETALSPLPPADELEDPTGDNTMSIGRGQPEPETRDAPVEGEPTALLPKEPAPAPVPPKPKPESRRQAAHRPPTATAAAPSSRGASRPYVMPAALGIAVVVAGVAGSFLYARLTKGTLEVRSTPSGAVVLLDGRALEQRTPVTVEGLEPRSYSVEVAKAGFDPWRSDRVELKKGQHLVVPAELVPEKPPIEVVVEGTQLTPKAPPGPAPHAVSWPNESFELEPALHRLQLGKAGATKIELSPGQTYRVSLARGPYLGWLFDVVNSAGAAPGTFGAQPLEIRGASHLYVLRVPTQLLTDADAKEETRPRALTVRPGRGRPTVVKISPRLDFPETARVTLTGLDPTLDYEVTLRQGATPAKRASGAQITSALLGAPLGLTVLELDKPAVVRKARRLWLSVLDDTGEGYEGRLRVEVRQIVYKPR